MSIRDYKAKALDKFRDQLHWNIQHSPFRDTRLQGISKNHIVRVMSCVETELNRIISEEEIKDATDDQE